MVSLGLNKPKIKAGCMRCTNESCFGVGQSGLCFLVLLTYLTLRCHCPSHRKALVPACPWGDCGLKEEGGGEGEKGKG